jgi:hypothetical protein
MLHIDLPTRAEILALASHRGGPCVSIYVATTPLSAAAQADRITLKNLLREAVAQLEAADTPKRSIWPIEAAVEAVIEDEEFWAWQGHALAIFATPDRLLTFRLPNRIQSMVEVSDRFHLKPILRAVTFPHGAYVLAASMGAARLIEVSPDLPPQPVPVHKMPRDMNDAIGRRSHIARDGRRESGEATSESALLTRYARAIDTALRPVLTGQEVPLVIASTEPLSSTLRHVLSYPHIAAQVIPGSADHTPDHELAAAARSVLDGIYAEDLAAFAHLYRSRENQGRATADIAQAARAATFGAVEALIVNMDEVVDGTVGDEDGAVTFADAPGADSYGVVDEIARRTLLAGGRVLSARAADLPGGGTHLAAILRYAI